MCRNLFKPQNIHKLYELLQFLTLKMRQPGDRGAISRFGICSWALLTYNPHSLQKCEIVHRVLIKARNSGLKIYSVISKEFKN